MRPKLFLFLTSTLLTLFFAAPIFAADFNIKLRKTDINELKQQLMPRFEQNISYLNGLLDCLELGKTVNNCLNEYVLLADKQYSSNSSDNKKRNDEIRKSIENKMNENNIQADELIPELKKWLVEAESIKDCLIKGQTANELKDCIVKH